MNLILKTKIDLNCLPKPLLEQLCALFTHEEIDRIKDKKDKFLSYVACLHVGCRPV